MIHLDANFLIHFLKNDSPQAKIAEALLARGESFAVSAVAWMEVVSGPVSAAQLEALSALIQDRIVPFDRAEAFIAASLFNAAGRKRSLRGDSMIAACAMTGGASLLTMDVVDFRLFEAAGLRLINPEV
jgi:predicted nucleic acid-binding protein